MNQRQRRTLWTLAEINQQELLDWSAHERLARLVREGKEPTTVRIAGLALVLAVLLTTALTSIAFAKAPVSFTWAAADLGQGCWGGGPLYADGTAGGSASCSFSNGQQVALLRTSSWTGSATDGVTICFDVVTIKGSFPPIECLGPLPVLGTPIKVGPPGQQTLIRVTPVQ